MQGLVALFSGSILEYLRVFVKMNQYKGVLSNGVLGSSR